MYQYLVDDAFYYFEIAKHIPEFNTCIANSGFHPLYAFLVSPLHTFLAYQLAIPLSLMILIISNCVAVFTLYNLLSLHWDNPIPIICATAWALSPKMYSLSMSGVETILAATIVLLFFLQFIQIANAKFENLSGLRLFSLGFTGGVAFLARMDSPLILAPALVYLTFMLIRRGRITYTIFLLLPALLPALTWIAYISQQTGQIFPTSGAALRVLRGIDSNLIATPELIYKSCKYLVAVFVDFFVTVPRLSKIILLIFFFLGGVVAILFNRRYQKRITKQFEVLTIAGLLLWCAYYILYQGGFRQWYLLQLGIGIYGIYLPLLLHTIFSFNMAIEYNQKRTWIVGTILIGVIAIFSQPKPQAPQEYDKYHSALAANEFIPLIESNGKIGAFNTGIYNYFMYIDVINLDGVVNPDAMKALRDNQLPNYIQQKNIRYLIEHDRGSSANFDRIYENPNFDVQKWVDLTEFYYGYNGLYTKHTYLWKLEFKEK
ncbi:MAG: hypothetical protein PVG32_15365 [Anaerolineales bacterium]